MDSQQLTAERVSKLVKSRRFCAFGIACLVLTMLVVLQVGNLNRNTPMCELLNDCRLANGDLQRMQIALSQSGLSEFKITENRLLVPTAQHSVYLQAIAEKNAIPQDLRDSEESGPSFNPFLSHSQQQSIERAAKKRQIREMVVRLPFVDQAWFEMDQSLTHSAFEVAKQSAVISIQPPQNIPLNDQHVDTVKQMIGGAVAGLDPTDIVVIDLSAGFAHQKMADPSTTLQIHYQRIAIEQQRFYENRIRETLRDYPGIKVEVHVEVNSDGQSDKMTSSESTQLPATQAVSFQSLAPIPVAGANAAASLQDFEASPQVRQEYSTTDGYQIGLTSHDEGTDDESLHKEISISIDVPQKLVHDLFGSPSIERSSARNHSEYQTALAKDTQKKFEQLRSEIIQKIRPVLPSSIFRSRAASPIAVNLIRQPLPPESAWTSQLQQFATQHWPSVAVLVIGLMLLSIVTRKPAPIRDHKNTPDPNINQDVLSIDSRQSNESHIDQNAEVRLANLIEKDPDAAAKVIEAWIRDAA